MSLGYVSGRVCATNRHAIFLFRIVAVLHNVSKYILTRVRRRRRIRVEKHRNSRARSELKVRFDRIFFFFISFSFDRLQRTHASASFFYHDRRRVKVLTLRSPCTRLIRFGRVGSARVRCFTAAVR